jgi:hypothetical protein
MTNQSRLTWLVEHRAQIQRLIHDLYLVLDDEDLRKRLETKPADCSIFGLFVGAAFPTPEDCGPWCAPSATACSGTCEDSIDFMERFDPPCHSFVKPPFFS